MTKNEIKHAVEHWLDDIVIGLGFCPFARQPRVTDRIDIYLSDAESIEALLLELLEQVAALENTSPHEKETTLFVIPRLLSDFEEYLDVLSLAEQIMAQQGWEGIFQLASFHPDYQFENTDPADIENYTNRSPFPIFHILREDSISAAVDSGNTEDIPHRNRALLLSLSEEERRSIFGTKY